MSETVNEDIETGTTPFTDESNREIAYRSDSAGATATASERPAVIAPGTGTGRRKEAVARVRLVPGTGSYQVNGRTLDEYFPNKVHQQLINEPFVAAGAAGAYDVIARIDGGGTEGHARGAALSHGVRAYLAATSPAHGRQRPHERPSCAA